MSFPTKTAYRQSLQQKSGQYHGTLSEHRFITRKEVEEFIEKIVVHERSEPWKKKNYTQQIDVYFNFVGQV